MFSLIEPEVGFSHLLSRVANRCVCHLLYFQIPSRPGTEDAKDLCDLNVWFYTHDIRNIMRWFINKEKYLLRVGDSWHWLRTASGEVRIFRHANKEGMWDFFFFFSSFLFRFLLPVLLPEVDEKTKDWTARFYSSLNWETKICMSKTSPGIPSRLSPVHGPRLFSLALHPPLELLENLLTNQVLLLHAPHVQTLSLKYPKPVCNLPPVKNLKVA